MKEELINVLRNNADHYAFTGDNGLVHLLTNAADAIEQLSADLERLKDYEAFWKEEAEEALRRFQLAIAHKPRWISVEERLPEIRKAVLITDGIDVGTGWMNQGWWNTWFTDIRRDEVTHWMPLPEPPEEET